MKRGIFQLVFPRDATDDRPNYSTLIAAPVQDLKATEGKVMDESVIYPDDVRA